MLPHATAKAAVKNKGEEIRSEYKITSTIVLQL